MDFYYTVLRRWIVTTVAIIKAILVIEIGEDKYVSPPQLGVMVVVVVVVVAEAAVVVVVAESAPMAVPMMR